MNFDKHPIAIIGGGITGLSAAWELQKSKPEQDYIVLEADSRWGGKVITKYHDNPQSIMDGGPESFVTRKPEVWDLAHELGIEDEIIIPGSETSGMNILFQGKVYSVPLHPIKFILSGLLSWRGKLRLLAEPFIKARRDYGDETLADFVGRRLGDEVLKRFIGPILGGIYNTDPNTQSILYTSPVMREMEREHGSLFKGSFARMTSKKKSDAAPKPSFIAFKNGSETLIDALIKQLKGDLRLNSSVQSIQADGESYQISLTNGQTITAKGIIIATPANIASQILESLEADAAAQLGQIRQSSLGTISLIYRSADLPQNAINGLMIPRGEKRLVDAIQFTSRRIENRTDDEHSLIRVFFGGAKPEMLTYDDAQCLEYVKNELRELLNITAEVLAYETFRWQGSYPIADVGHLEKVDTIQASLPKNIVLCGASYRGLGVPDCIRQGRDAAKQLLNI